MPYYICYLTSEDNKTIESEAGTHPTDEAAIKWAEGELSEHPDCAGVEVWREARRIYRNRRSDR